MATRIGLGKGPKINMKVADIIKLLEKLDLITVERKEYKKDGKLICADKYFIQAKFQERYDVIDGDMKQHQRKEVK